jgi:two-component system chemotaxis response regulator CheB
MTATEATRVVVADDSALMRRIVTTSLERAGVNVVGTAANGDEALAVCERERPDAMTLDLAMPGLDGIGVLRSLRERGASGLPVVVVSAFSPRQGARAVDALAEGAFDLVPKPAAGEGLGRFAENLITTVRVAAESARHRGNGGGSHASAPRRNASTRTARVVVIATSTGGPRALAALLPNLPGSLGMGTLIVQHMPAGFTASLAARLDKSSRLRVKEAMGGEILDPRTALIAPGGHHLRLSGEGRATLTDEPEIGGLRPRADLTIQDAAEIYGERLLLAVLTGMGADGLHGAEAVKRHGGRVIVESEQTCTVYGMPRSVVEAGLADHVVPLHEMPDAIVEEASGA